MDKFAADTNRILVINGEEVLDVTTFAKHHPGTPLVNPRWLGTHT